MGRKSRFTDEEFLDAALDLIGERGPNAATISTIGEMVGAPIGSVYHRFSSRDLLLAKLWLRVVESFQDGFLTLLNRGDGLSAALYTGRWVRENLNAGRVLLLYRREELISGEWPEEVRGRAEELARVLDDGIKGFTKRLFGEVGGENIQKVTFALIDVPSGAVRRYLQMGNIPPAIIDLFIEETYKTILGDHDENI
jgi:AcrR family transcriptional regulator